MSQRVFDELGFTVEHPLRERLEKGGMHGCALHQHLRRSKGAPVRPGRYRAVGAGERWSFTEVRDGD